MGISLYVTNFPSLAAFKVLSMSLICYFNDDVSVWASLGSSALGYSALPGLVCLFSLPG